MVDLQRSPAYLRLTVPGLPYRLCAHRYPVNGTVTDLS